MQFSTVDSELMMLFELDAEPGALRLTDDGLGDKILDIALLELISCHERAVSPAGTPWAENRPSTVARKGQDVVGRETGQLLDPENVANSPRQVEERWCSLTFHDTSGKALGFHLGRPGVQVPRPLIGWTEGAKRQAEDLVDEAIFQLDAEIKE